MDIRCGRCPGQDSIVKGPEDVEFECPNCHEIVEIWPPARGEKCPGCGNWVSRGETCADWCPGGEEMVRQCLGEERYKEWKVSKKVVIKRNGEKTMENHYCGHHNCIEELRADHEKILAELDKLEANPAGYAKEFLHFTENFAEPHHHKEEEVLFPALEKKGIPNEGGPIGVMLMEHEIKRGHVRDLAAGKIEAAGNIISLLRDHINKENNILYPMAEQVLTAEELAALAYKCEKLKKGGTVENL